MKTNKVAELVKYVVSIIAVIGFATGSLAAAGVPKERKVLVIPMSQRRELPPDVEATPGFRRIARYDAMHAVALPEQAYERLAVRLAAAGFEVRELEDVIRTPKHTLSTNTKSTTIASDEAGLFLIQYIAPPIPDWQAKVRQSGISVIDALPERAMIVAATAAQVRTLAVQPWVQYAGTYLPEFKSGPVAQAGHEIFQVQVADTAASAGYVEALRDRLGGFLEESRNDSDLIVRVRTDLATARSLLNDPYVVAVEAYFPPQPSDERQALSGTGVSTITSTLNYLNWLNARGIQPNNLTNDQWGRKIIIDIADTGIDLGCCNFAERHRDLNGRVVYNGGLGDSGGCAWADEQTHGTVVASIAAGVPTSGQNTTGTPTTGYGSKDSDTRGQFYYGLGVAPGIRLGNTRVIPQGVPAGTVNDWTRIAVTSRCNTPTQLCTGFELCPATVQNHSHNEYDDAGTGVNAGRYTFDSRSFDFRVRDANDSDGAIITPLAVTMSAGNYHQNASDFTKMVMASATAKNVITMGAVETHRTDGLPTACALNGEEIARNSTESFNVIALASRRGTLDGRLKPDLVAPATMSFGAQSQNNPSGYFCANPTNFYTGGSGTSFAAPVAAGSIALLRYYYDKNHGLTPSPAMYKAMLVTGARSITGGTDRLETYLQGTTKTVPKWPNALQGFGVINLTDLLTTGVTRNWRDQQTILTNGQILDMTVTVADPSKPVRIAIAWTDAPAAVDASHTLVNDLDLRAFATAFRVYGNLTATDGYSTINPGCGRPVCGSFADATNNVEALNINPSLFMDPANRTFTVRVSAANLQGIGVPGQSGGVNNQDFALFVINGTIQ